MQEMLFALRLSSRFYVCWRIYPVFLLMSEWISFSHLALAKLPIRNALSEQLIELQA